MPNALPETGNVTAGALSNVTVISSFEAVDWIVSDQMTARNDAKFRFYAKSYDGDNTYHPWAYLTVLVSTTDNAVSSFTPLSGFTSVQVPHKNNNDSHNIVDRV